jgi:hypothetical protein
MRVKDVLTRVRQLVVHVGEPTLPGKTVRVLTTERLLTHVFQHTQWSPTVDLLKRVFCQSREELVRVQISSFGQASETIWGNTLHGFGLVSQAENEVMVDNDI